MLWVEEVARIVIGTFFVLGALVFILGSMAGLEMVISQIEHWRDLVLDQRWRERAHRT